MIDLAFEFFCMLILHLVDLLLIVCYCRIVFTNPISGLVLSLYFLFLIQILQSLNLFQQMDFIQCLLR